MRSLALPALVCLALGLAWAIRSASASSLEASPGAGPATLDPAPGGAGGGGPTLVQPSSSSGKGGPDRSRPAAPDPGTEADREPELFSEALLEHYAREYRRGWLSVRDSEPGAKAIAKGEGKFRKEVLALPFRLGKRAAGEVLQQEEAQLALETGDGISVLKAIRDGYQPSLEEATGDFLDRAVENRGTSGAIDGADFVAGKAGDLVPGAVLRFGPGVHRIYSRRMRNDDGSIPADVTIVGAGMDLTLLRMNDFDADADVERLTFRDLTIDSQNDGPFDLRGEHLLTDFQRVRIVRFDGGHAGCRVFRVDDGAIVRARDCQFIGGYGSSPGSGKLFSGHPILARFENCRFELLGVNHDLSSKVAFIGCRFELMREDLSKRDYGGETFQRCSFGPVLGPNVAASELKKDMADLYWGAEGK